MADLEGIPARQLSDLIAAMYDCAVDPRHWAVTCRQAARQCESNAGGLCVHDLRYVRDGQVCVYGYQAQFLEKLGTHHSDAPMDAAHVFSHLGECSTLSIECFHLLESRLHSRLLGPPGLVDMVCLPAMRAGGRMVFMHLSRTDTDPNYRLRDAALFELLAAHACKVLAVADLLDSSASRVEDLVRTLDGLAAGVFLMARDARVLHMNQAAECQVRKGDALRVVNDSLVPADAAARAALSKAITECARHDASPIGNSAHCIAIPDGAGGGYVATLLPIGGGQRSRMLPREAALALFTQDPGRAAPVQVDAFARLHGLTGGELRVLVALSHGLGGREAADTLGIGEPTLRTHLQHLFSKTGTSRQSELLRRLHDATPPTRPGETQSVTTAGAPMQERAVVPAEATELAR
jgi:DNA-binding CsgD family transcriptional regulator